MKKLLMAVVLLCSASTCLAEDDSDIVTGCLMSNAEFGTDMAQICIAANKTARDEVARYPTAVKDIVEFCMRRQESGWEFVKKCIDEDIAAAPVLAAYARDHAPFLETCKEKFLPRDASRIRRCVETALEDENARGSK